MNFAFSSLRSWGAILAVGIAFSIGSHDAAADKPSPGTNAPAAGTPQDDPRETAMALAELLGDGRQVISVNQPLINNPDIGPKGLTGEKVLALASENFRQNQGRDIASYPESTRTGRLLRLLAIAMRETMDENQATIDTPGVGFKGFIPAVFGRLVSERFVELANGEAALKVTAPLDLVRNRRARPDAWESSVIETQFRSVSWEKGRAFQAETEMDGRRVFRLLIPEYYAQSCLSCHGSPKGELDRTGYPMEGGAEGDLGGIISILLASN